MKYRICTKTVMDNAADPDIVFDEAGVCHYYHEYMAKLAIRVPEGAVREANLLLLLQQIKKAGKGKRYDCVIGISGGVDSSYVAWLTRQWGLRPLAVHVDNGWNSELAVSNIEQQLRILGIDLVTEVLDWSVFRDLQWSFLKASVPDAEVPTDHVVFAALYKAAARHGIRHILTGMNFRTEGMLPKAWSRGHLDWRYISSVHKIFGTVPIHSLPHISISRFLWYNVVKRIRMVGILNYVDFSKATALEVLQRELGYRPYDGKHHESVYTRFFQSYILPKKFGIDKRRAHLSCLIAGTGELTREEALRQLEQPPMAPNDVLADKDYVIKKLNITPEQFEEMMAAPPRTIFDYPNHYKWEQRFRQALHAGRRRGWLPN
ncbi:MAG: N-acetyl sugar amidotransferase [Chitinophagaceae bacterium]|nr:N-acetyl sugar amidotransferase [Chitinophagaceae bacterium]